MSNIRSGLLIFSIVILGVGVIYGGGMAIIQRMITIDNYSWKGVSLTDLPQFEIEIWQGGNHVEPIDGTVLLEKRPFQLRLTHPENKLIKINFSNKSSITKALNEVENLNHISVFNLDRAYAISIQNESRSIGIASDAHHHLSEESYDKVYQIDDQYVHVLTVDSVFQGEESTNLLGVTKNIENKELYVSGVVANRRGEGKYEAIAKFSLKLQFTGELNVSGATDNIHPACFNFAAPWGEEVVSETFDCTEEARGLNVDRNEYGFITYLPGTEEDFRQPFIQLIPYRGNYREEENVVSMVVLHGGGGTGIFSSIVSGEVVSSNEIKPHFVIKGGDRCNGGIIDIDYIDESRIVYRVLATPFMILNYDDNKDWRNIHLSKALAGESSDLEAVGTHNNWRPYKDVENGAMFCAGEIQKELDFRTLETKSLSVVVDKKALQAGGIDELENCFKSWGDGLPEGGVFVDVSTWESHLLDLVNECKTYKPVE